MNSSNIKDNFNKEAHIFFEEAKDNYQKFKNPTTRKIEWANFWTLIRFVLTPVIILAMALGQIGVATIIAIMAACTDFLDGHYARKYKSTSNFGAKFDAITDKCFTTGLCISLAFGCPILLLNMLAELPIAAINGISYLKGYKTKTNMLGKIKTCLLYLTIIAGFLSLFLPNLTGYISSLSLTLPFITSSIQALNSFLPALQASLPILVGSSLLLQVASATSYGMTYKKQNDKKLDEPNKIIYEQPKIKKEEVNHKTVVSTYHPTMEKEEAFVKTIRH